MSSSERKYPQWFEDFLDAETDTLPGFLGDWWDAGIHIEETENSITCYSIIDFTKVNEEPDVTFYGDQRSRRIRLVEWFGGVLLGSALARIYKHHPDLISNLGFEEMPLRLMFSEEYGNEVFGKEWQ